MLAGSIFRLLVALLPKFRRALRPRRGLVVENLALRQQMSALAGGDDRENALGLRAYHPSSRTDATRPANWISSRARVWSFCASACSASLPQASRNAGMALGSSMVATDLGIPTASTSASLATLSAPGVTQFGAPVVR